MDSAVDTLVYELQTSSRPKTKADLVRSVALVSETSASYPEGTVLTPSPVLGASPVPAVSPPIVSPTRTNKRNRSDSGSSSSSDSESDSDSEDEAGKILEILAATPLVSRQRCRGDELRTAFGYSYRWGMDLGSVCFELRALKSVLREQTLKRDAVRARVLKLREANAEQ